jgi:hypothetical protein
MIKKMRQTVIHITLHKIIKIEQHEPDKKKWWMISGAQEGKDVLLL